MKTGTVEVQIKITDIEMLKGLSEYFAKEIAEGKTEFKIKISDTEIGAGYIHPLDKDGSTYDFNFSETLNKED